MIPFDPADIWLWGSPEEDVSATTADHHWIGEVQQLGFSLSMDTSLGAME